MATIRTMNRRRRMRTNEAYVLGVFFSDADGKMGFRFEKAIAGRWQRFTPRGQAGAIAKYSADLGQIVVTDEELGLMLDRINEGSDFDTEVDTFVVNKAINAITEEAYQPSLEASDMLKRVLKVREEGDTAPAVLL